MLISKKIKLEVSEQDAATLEFMQGKCRGLYNWWIMKLRDGEKGPGWEEAKKTLQESKQHNPELKWVYGKLLQEVYFRLDGGMRAFFRRVKNGEKPGFPRVRPRRNFFTLCFDPVCRRLYAAGLSHDPRAAGIGELAIQLLLVYRLSRLSCAGRFIEEVGLNEDVLGEPADEYTFAPRLLCCTGDAQEPVYQQGDSVVRLIRWFCLVCVLVKLYPVIKRSLQASLKFSVSN